MTWLDAGDRLVKKIWLDRIPVIGPQEPRSLRWLPLLILVAVSVGYPLLVSLHDRGFFDGPVSPLRIGTVIVATFLFFGGFTASSFIRFFGPRLGSRMGAETLDERELVIRARAFALSGSAIACFAIIGCFYFGLSQIIGEVFGRYGWMPATSLEWLFLGMVLQAWWMTLPVLIASWLQPREAPDAGE